jgi:hypothetical protein
MRHLSRKRALTAVLAPLGLAASLLAASPAIGARTTQELPLSLCAPPPENTFSLTIDNPFDPLPVGQQWVYSGREQGQTLGLRITVLNDTENFYSGKRRVTTRVVEELEWEDADADGVVDDDEFVIEVSRNYYAQTLDDPTTPEDEGGTVCYFGEDVDIFNEDGTVTHEGAWRADDPGNAPGIFMPADPQVGMTFQQEHAPGVAQDTATIVRKGTTVSVPAGTFTDTITVRDFNPLDGSRGTKVYAADGDDGTGLITDGPLDLISYSEPLNPG